MPFYRDHVYPHLASLLGDPRRGPVASRASTGQRARKSLQVGHLPPQLSVRCREPNSPD